MSVKNRFEIRFNIKFHLKVLSQNPIIVVSPYVLSLPLLCSTQVSMAMQAHWSTVSQGLTLYNSQTNIDSRYTLCMSVCVSISEFTPKYKYIHGQIAIHFLFSYIHSYVHIPISIDIYRHTLLILSFSLLASFQNIFLKVNYSQR